MNLDPARVRSLFYLLQIGLGVLVLLAVVFRNRKPPSNFRVREAELKPPRAAHASAGADALGQARIQPKAPPLALPGIRIDGPPHEVLGVPPGADAEQVQRAYRELMKRYHPDKVGRPGTREWQDAQRIAEALNRAKEQLLKNRRGT